MKQVEALDVLKLGYNVFLTGAAGAGKTYVLNQFIEHLKKHKIGVGVTASTGIAATHMNGMTIHSWAGIGIHDDIDEHGLKKLTERAQLVKRFDKTKVLIIDEVSMLHGQRLDLVDKVCRAFKDKSKPFGGLQVILSGDMFQLPPVTRSGDVDWVFSSNAWKNMDLKVCYLDEQHRQDDSELLDILNAIRDGEVEEEHQRMLTERMGVPVPANMRITRLYTHNSDVDEINEGELRALESDSRSYVMTSSKGGKKLVEGLMASCLAPELLTLKIGSEVMFVANNAQERYVNGTRGQVIGFTEENMPVIVTTEGRTIVPSIFSWRLSDGDKIRAEISQLPLRLAWAITVHKSQGMSLDAAQIDLSRAFEPGMGYVAVSRVRRLDGLYLTGANSQALAVHPHIKEFDLRIQKQSSQLVKALAALDSEKVQSNHQRVVVALAPEPPEELIYDENLFEELKEWRTKKAKKKSVPAYIIMDDKTLKAIAAQLPKNDKELLKVKGIGPQKLEEYGEGILKIIKTFDKG